MPAAAIVGAHGGPGPWRCRPITARSFAVGWTTSTGRAAPLRTAAHLAARGPSPGEQPRELDAAATGRSAAARAADMVRDDDRPRSRPEAGDEVGVGGRVDAAVDVACRRRSRTGAEEPRDRGRRPRPAVPTSATSTGVAARTPPAARRAGATRADPQRPRPATRRPSDSARTRSPIGAVGTVPAGSSPAQGRHRPCLPRPQQRAGSDAGRAGHREPVGRGGGSGRSPDGGGVADEPGALGRQRARRWLGRTGRRRESPARSDGADARPGRGADDHRRAERSHPATSIERREDARVVRAAHDPARAQHQPDRRRPSQPR